MWARANEPGLGGSFGLEAGAIDNAAYRGLSAGSAQALSSKSPGISSKSGALSSNPQGLSSNLGKLSGKPSSKFDEDRRSELLNELPVAARVGGIGQRAAGGAS